MDIRLSLSNPRWRTLVANLAQEYTSQGRLQDFISANGFDDDVIRFITETV